jgi:hypothetical protein
MRPDRDVDLALASALAVCALLAGSLLPEGALLRVALTGPLVFIAPGYAIAAASLQRSRPGLLERLALGLGLSLALAACGALVLNLTPWGLNSTSWMAFLAAITLGASLLAWYARATDPARRAVRVGGLYPNIRPLDAALLMLAALIGAVTLGLSTSPPPQQPSQSYALLWAVPDKQTTATIHLGVQNMLPSREDYVLRVEQYDQTIQEYAIQLEPAQTWQTDLQLSPGAMQTGADIQAVLFRADSPFTPFRQAVVRAT